MPKDNLPKRILRRPEVRRRTGLSDSTIYLRMSEGTFPKSVPLGGRLVGWLESDILNFIDNCIANSNEASKGGIMNKQPMTSAPGNTSNADSIRSAIPLEPNIRIKPPFKLERVLTCLVRQGSMNRLEAEKAPVFDHTLNSTMSTEIKQRLGLVFTSIPEKTVGYNGLGAIFNRYTLTAQSAIKAKFLINEYRAKRGASPIQWEGVA